MIRIPGQRTYRYQSKAITGIINYNSRSSACGIQPDALKMRIKGVDIYRVKELLPIFITGKQPIGLVNKKCILEVFLIFILWSDHSYPPFFSKIRLTKFEPKINHDMQNRFKCFQLN
jgi:hypothetical protein